MDSPQLMMHLIETPQYLRELYYSNAIRVITPLQIIFEEEDQRIEFDEQSVSRLRMVNFVPYFRLLDSFYFPYSSFALLDSSWTSIQT